MVKFAMLSWLSCIRCLLAIVVVGIVALLLPNPPAYAAIDPYVVRYLHVTEPIALEADGKGETRSFSPEEISQGKQLFSGSCLGCHVGGSTLPDPLVSLSLEKLKGANPSRDNINSLVAYLRQPMSYDGTEETYSCRQVPESWMSQEQVENLAAFILTAAQKAPGWGSETF
jgi:photosystem II cytochrome c550